MSPLTLSALLLALFYAPLGLTLPEDSEQPIYINSDSAIKDEKQGLTIYRGNVDMTQGTLRINADKITIHSNTENVTKIIAEGNPAKLKQKPELNKSDINAQADLIEYWVGEKRLDLSQDAFIGQDGSTISGQSITYDMNASRIEAEGSSNEQEKERVQVVIPPRASQP